MCYDCCVNVRVHRHALKHGLSEKQICSAFAQPVPGFDSVIRYRDIDTEPQRYAQIGFDPFTGMEIELVFVYLAGGGVMIIHANKATKGFKKEMKEARNG